MASHVTTFGKQYITASLGDVERSTPFLFSRTFQSISLTLWRTHQSGLIQIAGNGYTALRLTESNMDWVETISKLRNSVALVFPSATGDWGTVTHLGVGDIRMEQVLFWIKLAMPIAIENGDRFVVEQYDLIFTPPA